MAAIAESMTLTYDPKEAAQIKTITRLTTGKLAEALAKAQADFRPVPKTKTAKINSTFSYKYADLCDVLGMAVPILAKHGIAFTQPIRREGDKMYVVTRLQFGDEILEDSGLPVPSQVKPQEMGTYITYARRYGVSTFLGIAADEDTDAQETREDKPVSSSGQTSSVGRTASGQTPTQEAKQFVKRGRPANPPIVKATEIVPPTPVENAGPQIATDEDVPNVIGSKPTKSEMDGFKKRLASFDVDREALKKFVLKDAGRTEAKDLTAREWEATISKLEAAQNLKELVNG